MLGLETVAGNCCWKINDRDDPGERCRTWFLCRAYVRCIHVAGLVATFSALLSREHHPKRQAFGHLSNFTEIAVCEYWDSPSPGILSALIRCLCACMACGAFFAHLDSIRQEIYFSREKPSRKNTGVRLVWPRWERSTELHRSVGFGVLSGFACEV